MVHLLQHKRIGLVLQLSAMACIAVACKSKFHETNTSSDFQSTRPTDPNSSTQSDAPLPTGLVRLDEIRNFVEQRQRINSSPLKKMYSFESYCLDYSALWLKELQQSPFKGYLQQTQGVHFFTIDRKKVMRSPTHFFIAFNPKTTDEIILDVTYGQFILGAESLALDPILLAKTSEIENIFSKYKSRIRIKTSSDDFIGRYDPQEATELIYSTGRFSKNRTSFDSDTKTTLE